MQTSLSSLDSQQMELGLNLYEARNADNDGESTHLAEFKCIGAVTSQNLSVSDGSYLSGDFNIQQVIK